MSGPVLDDQHDRDRAIHELGTTFLVEAGAGTGKTTILVERLVNLVVSGADLSRVAAITFTEKAAAELKVRLRDRLEQRAAELLAARDERGARRLAVAVEGLEAAAVTTIHGFCAALLRERPVEAGVDPGFEVAADDLDLLVDEAFAAFLDECVGAESAALSEAFAAGLTVTQLRDLGERVIHQRDLIADERFELPEVEPPDGRAFLGAFSALIDHLEKTLDACTKPAEDRGWLQVDALRRLRDALTGLPDEEACAELIEQLPNTGAGAKPNWKPHETLADNKRRIAELAGVRREFAKRLRAHRAARLLAELARLPRIYDRVKERRSALDFQDLLIHTRDLLKNDVATRRDFQRGFDSILLDEFQDTDPLQAEIAFFLAEDPRGAPAGDWSEVTIGPGRLFLVGDPKQSIYRFRRADIEVYERARERVEQSGGAVLTISVNFRSVPAVLNWVNDRFGRLIEAPADGQRYQPDYVPIEAAAGATDSGPGVLVLAHSERPDGYDSVGLARAAEANAVAAFVKRLVTDPVRQVPVVSGRGDRKRLRPATYGDCAVLFRTTSGLAVFEDALRAHRVPYRVGGGKHLYSRAEVKAAVALFRAVDDPGDDVAMLATLRGPLFGVSDADLLRFHRAGGRFDRFEDDPGEVAPPLAGARRILRALHERRHAAGLAEFVAHALAATRALELFHLKPMGEQRVANLLKFVDMARRLEHSEQRTFRAFVEAVKRMESESRDEAEAVLADDGSNCVQLLTMHRAKGLEFPVVVLADLHAAPRGGDTFLFDRGPPPAIEFAAGPKEQRLLETSGFERLRAADQLRADAEMVRLLYVAATRARSLLVLPRFFKRPGKSAPRGFPAFLAGDPLYEAPVAELGERFVDAAALEFDAGEDRPYRLDVDLDGALPAVARDVLAERERCHAELRSLFTDRRHQRAVSSASAEKDAVGFRFVGAADAAVAPGDPLRGKAFGTLVHRLLERVDFRGPNAGLGLLASAFAVEEGLPPEAAAAAERLVRSVLDSELAGRLAAAARLDTEVPFVFERDGGLLEGAIDLLAEEADGGFLVVDWKTDDVGGAALEERLAGYRPQGEIYAAAVLAATGRSVNDVLFVFVRSGEVRSLSTSGGPSRQR